VSDFYTVIKAVMDGDDWVLDVLVAPFGSPWRRDGQGEWFSPRTNTRPEWYPSPPVIYYHGFTERKDAQATPEPIGRTVERTVKPDGIWYRVVLDKASAYAAKVWRAAQRGAARASPGGLGHLVRKLPSGELLHWAIAEISIFDTDDGQKPASPYAVALPALKAIYDAAGIPLPITEEPMEEEELQPTGDHVVVNDDALSTAVARAFDAGRQSMQEMTERDLNALINQRLQQAEARTRLTRAQEQQQQAAIKAAQEETEARLRAEFDEQMRLARRLPGGGGLDYGAFGRGPHATQFAELRPYDNLDAANQALLVGVLQAAKRGGRSVYGASGSAYKALVVKLSEDTSEGGQMGAQALKMMGAPLPEGGALKANELMRNDYTNYGDEWVGVVYSTMLWERIRHRANVLNRIRQVEVPQGAESLPIPVETGGFTFYKVARAADTGTSGWPNATIPASKGSTDNKTLTPGKLGARSLWNGELEEDSLIPFVDWVRRSLEEDGAEYLESAIIDGDERTAATTNINDIGDASAQAGDEYYLLVNGFRKVALIDASGANARSATTLAADDYLETLKLLGPAGINAIDRTAVGFVIDVNTHWATLNLTEVKTRDVYAAPTIENGVLVNIFGRDVLVSGQMHRMSAKRMANSSGFVHATDTNNTTGSLLAVRWDQWVFGWKRRMKLEVSRIPRADADEIVATMRFDLINRDDEAAAISYNITV
jgi:HK97 family phage major capsid protein